MRIKTLSIILTIVTLASCGDTIHSLTAGNFSKTETYKIDSYYSCCGCEGKYVIINAGKRKLEQIIYSYNCYNIGKPTKFIFNYNDKGKLISCDKYVATTTNDYTQALTEQEIKLLSIVGTDSLLKANHTTIKLSEITGFRKPVDNEVTHAFPLIKKGHKLKINE